MPANELAPNTIGAPLAWAHAELRPEDRPAALARLEELGISKWVFSKVCRVKPSRVTNWKKDGFPTRDGNYSMAVLDRLSSLVEHMQRDLDLDEDTIADFIKKEPNSRDWQIDDSEETDRWRHASIVQNSIGGYRKWQSESHQRLEERLQERFPDNYRAYLDRLQASLAPEE